MPIPSGSLFSTSKELVNVPVQLLYSRRKLFEKIIANVAKRKLENHVQATGDRMSMTPQQFGMNIAHQTKKAGQTKKAFMVGGTIGALGGLATSKKNKRGLGAGRGALIGGGTELGVYPGAALGGMGGLALGGLISTLIGRNGDQQIGDMLTSGALGAGAGALGGGYLGNIASRALLDDSSHSKQDEKKKKEETKEAVVGAPINPANIPQQVKSTLQSFGVNQPAINRARQTVKDMRGATTFLADSVGQLTNSFQNAAQSAGKPQSYRDLFPQSFSAMHPNPHAPKSYRDLYRS